ncbi:MAG: PEP-CTERM sorting domain-containing protein [Bryobacteraceae bacterium]|nr:PEP-CTERM sorting domain-containing protein [Bryobacteraceae bacterium]
MKKAAVCQFAFLAALLLALPSGLGAAYILIDDRDPNTITISAGDFEEGFYLEGNLFTMGLGNGNTQTLPDGGYNISGSWIDLGQSGNRVDLLFTMPGDPSLVFSGIEFGTSTDGVLGTLNGSFGGATGSYYFTTVLPTALQNGQALDGAAPFLSVRFISEAVVPEPSTLLLLSVVAPIIIAARRRRRA